MRLILRCLNETRDLFNITAAQTVENNAQQSLLFALFWPSPGCCRHIYVSYLVVYWVFSTILTLHTVYYHTLSWVHVFGGLNVVVYTCLCVCDFQYPYMFMEY